MAHPLLDKAKAFAESAVIMFAARKTDAAAGEAYYAMFNAARALLATDPEFKAKTHSTTLSEFNKKFVRTGRIDVRYGHNLQEAERLRHIADYEGFSADVAEVARTVDEAIELVAVAAKILLSEPSAVASMKIDKERCIHDAIDRLGAHRLSQERVLGAARIIVTIAQSRGHDVPDHFAEKLVIYCDEDKLGDIAEQIDGMGDDLIEFVRSFGVSIPDYK